MAIHQRLLSGLPFGKTSATAGSNAYVGHQTHASTHRAGWSAG